MLSLRGQPLFISPFAIFGSWKYRVKMEFLLADLLRKGILEQF